MSKMGNYRVQLQETEEYRWGYKAAMEGYLPEKPSPYFRLSSEQQKAYDLGYSDGKNELRNSV